MLCDSIIQLDIFNFKNAVAKRREDLEIQDFIVCQLMNDLLIKQNEDLTKKIDT